MNPKHIHQPMTRALRLFLLAVLCVLFALSGYDLRFGRPPFVSHQKWHGWNCQVDIIPHGCCPVAETKINAALSAVPLQMAHAASVRYVKPGGMTSGLCDSWINACALQYALGLAASGDEIWAQAGTYTPGIFRSDTFQLRNGIALYGGFGGTESVRNDRNITANVTVLSGDLLGNDNTNVKYD